PDAQIVIFGKEGHAEVVGLVGQTDGHAIVVEHPDQLDRIDFHKDIFLFSQTTKSTDEFRQLVSNIKERNRQSEPVRFEHFDTICRNVANRVENLRAFASEHDIVVFVGGRKSSNAKVLFSHCQEANPGTLFVSLVEELTDEWFSRLRQMVNKPLAECRIGICGATSTPQWLMEKVAKRIEDEC
ncbi:MAG: 4-hydroxy-3-methylbut-2-enyl diphosphate reductase, partial [Bacteroidales bacterium]|nr:4-hydroxy-3-methylbut-2-enyl diphosphate reductase [Candidatus Colicola faecequi]